MKTELTQEILKDLLEYNPETGELIWKHRDVKYFKNPKRSGYWNARWPGKIALGAINGSGYKSGMILGNNVQAQRMIWMLVYGEWPDQVDHKNGDRTDNRLCNLENVCQSKNQRNAFQRKDNTSGATGVYWHVRDNLYNAKIFVSGKSIWLGEFKDFDEAVAARKMAEEKYGFSPRHGERKQTSE